jgi:hypothetical protein
VTLNCRLNADIERLREERRRWITLADQRAIEVGTLKTEIKRLQRAIESSTGP